MLGTKHFHTMQTTALQQLAAQCKHQPMRVEWRRRRRQIHGLDRASSGTCTPNGACCSVFGTAFARKAEFNIAKQPPVEEQGWIHVHRRHFREEQTDCGPKAR